MLMQHWPESQVRTQIDKLLDVFEPAPKLGVELLWHEVTSTVEADLPEAKKAALQNSAIVELNTLITTAIQDAGLAAHQIPLFRLTQGQGVVRGGDGIHYTVCHLRLLHPCIC